MSKYITSLSDKQSLSVYMNELVFIADDVERYEIGSTLRKGELFGRMKNGTQMTQIRRMTTDY